MVLTESSMAHSTGHTRKNSDLETDSGGVVTYLYREERGGVLGSRYRRDALQIVEKKCPAGYTVLREGEAQTSQSVSGVIEGTEDEPTGRRWAIQFRCK